MNPNQCICGFLHRRKIQQLRHVITVARPNCRSGRSCRDQINICSRNCRKTCVKAWTFFRCSNYSYIRRQVSVESPGQSIGRYRPSSCKRDYLTNSMDTGICSARRIQCPGARHNRLNGFLQGRLNCSDAGSLGLISAEISPIVLNDQLQGSRRACRVAQLPGYLFWLVPIFSGTTGRPNAFSVTRES